MTERPSVGARYQPLGVHRDDPFGLYAQARREEPVFFSPELNAWVVTRYADVREVLRSPETFSSANAIPMPIPPTPAALEELNKGYPPAPVPTNSDGDAHARLRSAMAPAFATEHIEAAVGLIRGRAEALVDGFAGAGRAEFMGQYANRLPVEVITAFCGLELADAEVVQAGGAGIVALVGTPMSETEQATCAQDYVALQDLVAEAVRARRAQPRPDLVSAMVAALAPGSEALTFEQETELVNNLIEVLVPGHITLNRTLGNGVHALLADRAQWERLVAQPALIPTAAQEVCRYATPMAGQGRVTTRPVRLGGVELPGGAALAVMFDAANRDEEMFGDPEHFRADRQPNRHLTFGLGTHYCVGAALARMQIEITLATLTRRLPTLRLAGPKQVEIAPVYQLRGPAELQVAW